jgi:hypothetical protein
MNGISQADWQTVCSAPMAVASAVIAADFGITTCIQESKAAVQHLESYPSNGEWMREVIKGALDGASENEAAASGDTIGVALTTLRKAMTVVKAYAPDQIAAYSALVTSLAEQVANAAGEGFFGGGERVSDDERAVLAQIADVLQKSSN